MIHQDSDPIHGWFGLSYNDHLVLDPVRTALLPAPWHLEMAAMLDRLTRSFPDINPDGVETVALAAEASEYGELSDNQLQQLGITAEDSCDHDSCNHDPDDEDDCDDPDPTFYDWRGDSHAGWEEVRVPTETLQQARAADRIVVSRTLLQSMPVDWQTRFVQLLGQILGQAGSMDAPGPECYDIRFYAAAGYRTTDPVPHYRRGRTRLTPTVIAP